MTNKLDESLNILHTEVVKMGEICESSVALLVDLIEKNQQYAYKILDLETRKNERKIENICLKLLLTQQPVAKDLRNILTTLKMITDMERICEQSKDIAKILLEIQTIEKSNNILDIAKESLKMVTGCIDCYILQDLEMCRKTAEKDDIVDELFIKIKADIEGDIKNPLEVSNNINTLIIAKHFEKIADHATNIAQWVEFGITGKHKRR